MEAIPKHKGPEILKAILVLILVPRSKAKIAMIRPGINKIKKSQYEIAPLENPLKYIPSSKKNSTPYLDIS